MSKQTEERSPQSLIARFTRLAKDILNLVSTLYERLPREITNLGMTTGILPAAFSVLLLIPFLLADNATLLIEAFKGGKQHGFPFSVFLSPPMLIMESIIYLGIAFFSLVTLSKWYFKKVYTALRAPKGDILLVLLATGFTYFIIVHIFACIYLGLVYLDPDSLDYPGKDLKEQGLDVVSAYYFSLTTIATVGFGDIHPSSSSSMLKLVVMTEILIGLAYGVFIFSILATFIKEMRSEAPNGHR